MSGSWEKHYDIEHTCPLAEIPCTNAVRANSRRRFFELATLCAARHKDARNAGARRNRERAQTRVVVVSVSLEFVHARFRRARSRKHKHRRSGSWSEDTRARVSLSPPSREFTSPGCSMQFASARACDAPSRGFANLARSIAVYSHSRLRADAPTKRALHLGITLDSSSRRGVRVVNNHVQWERKNETFPVFDMFLRNRNARKMCIWKTKTRRTCVM